MHVGIFAKTFPRTTLEETLDAVVEHGIGTVQFNMACAHVPSMPDEIPGELADRIRGALHSRSLVMAAVSGTFNMIHPDEAQRLAGLNRLRVLADSCHRMGAPVITLCTGTRDSHDMWRRHPENDSTDAWRTLRQTMDAALAIAEEFQVFLGIEPEVSNVVDSASKGRRLLNESGSPWLRVVIDGANLFHAGELPQMHEILDEAFDLLGDAIVLAHAKDLSSDGQAGHEAAGTGLLDYPHYIECLRGVGYTGPLILHGLEESQVRQSADFLTHLL